MWFMSESWGKALWGQGSMGKSAEVGVFAPCAWVATKAAVDEGWGEVMRGWLGPSGDG
jgi:hypothetical protein